MDVALDGMVRCVEDLGDDRVNQRPELAGANSPYVILHHCVQLTHWWVGAMCVGRAMHRDRDGEFVASGRVADVRNEVAELKAMLADHVPGIDVEAPVWYPDRLPEGSRARTWTRGRCLLHTYEELAQHHGHMELTRDLLMV